ncbi:MAG: MIP/aquaporin family protein [Pseudomonadota bacterium]
MTILRRLIAEALGTLILIATVIGSGIMAETLTDDTALALWANTSATASILVVLILIFGPISGAHFNPAVTLSFRIRGDISNVLAGAYVLAQVSGGILGVMLAHAMFDQALLQTSMTVRTGLSQWLSEGVATFALIAAILGTVRFKPDAVPYAVGLVILAGYWWTASTSFANPAVTIARTFTDTFSSIRPGDAPGFIAAQIVAAALTTPCLLWLFAEDSKKSETSDA